MIMIMNTAPKALSASQRHVMINILTEMLSYDISEGHTTLKEEFASGFVGYNNYTDIQLVLSCIDRGCEIGEMLYDDE